MFVLSMLLMSQAFAQNYFAGKSPDQIIELKKNATLKIEILSEKNKVVNTFAGFFVGTEGRFATVNHTFKEDFKLSGKTKLRVRDFSGKEYSEIILEGCSNKNNIDLCTGKIKDLKPKYYFELASSQRREGELFSSLGHCKGNSELGYYTSKKGEIKKITDNYQNTYNAVGDMENLNTRLFEVSLPKCVGDSGGPIFDQYSGALLGMYSFDYKNHYFAIDASEINKLLESNLNASLYAIPDSRIYTEKPCAHIKEGTREYENCKLFE